MSFKKFLYQKIYDCIADDVIKKVTSEVCKKMENCIEERMEKSLRELYKYEELKEKTDEEFYKLYKYRKIKQLSSAELIFLTKRFNIFLYSNSPFIGRKNDVYAREGEFVGEILEKVFERRNSKAVASEREVQDAKTN